MNIFIFNTNFPGRLTFTIENLENFEKNTWGKYFPLLYQSVSWIEGETETVNSDGSILGWSVRSNQRRLMLVRCLRLSSLTFNIKQIKASTARDRQMVGRCWQLDFNTKGP